MEAHHGQFGDTTDYCQTYSIQYKDPQILRGLYSKLVLTNPGSSDTAERQFWENPDIWQYFNRRVAPLLIFFV